VSEDSKDGGDGDRVELVTLEDFERRARDYGDADAVEVVRPGGDEPAPLATSEGEALPAESAHRALVKHKADMQLRTLGRAIDVVIFAIVAESIAYLGPIVALAYLLFADGLFDGASLGKKVGKQRVVRIIDGKPARLFDSLLRNAPLGIAGLFVLIPIVGWALFLTLGLAVILFESYLVWKDPHGIRAGDILAGTQVVSASEEIPELDAEAEDQ